MRDGTVEFFDHTPFGQGVSSGCDQSCAVCPLSQTSARFLGVTGTFHSCPETQRDLCLQDAVMPFEGIISAALSVGAPTWVCWQT